MKKMDTAICISLSLTHCALKVTIVFFYLGHLCLHNYKNNLFVMGELLWSIDCLREKASSNTVNSNVKT